MQKLIELKKDENILVSSKLESFLKPDYVYLPVLKNNTILVHKNDFVKIGDEVITGMLSPVSGVVSGLKKLNSLQDADYYLEIANDFEGVEKSYALSAGRELRVLVKPDLIDDRKSHKLARDIKEKIESELRYPGTVKITVVRETRAVEEAK